MNSRSSDDRARQEAIDKLNQIYDDLSRWHKDLFGLVATHPGLKKEAQNLQIAIDKRRQVIDFERIAHEFGRAKNMFDTEG